MSNLESTTETTIPNDWKGPSGLKRGGIGSSECQQAMQDLEWARGAMSLILLRADLLFPRLWGAHRGPLRRACGRQGGRFGASPLLGPGIRGSTPPHFRVLPSPLAQGSRGRKRRAPKQRLRGWPRRASLDCQRVWGRVIYQNASSAGTRPQWILRSKPVFPLVPIKPTAGLEYP
jgi:hypothetical protein